MTEKILSSIIMNSTVEIKYELVIINTFRPRGGKGVGFWRPCI